VNAAIARGSTKRNYSNIRVPALALVDGIRSSNDLPLPNEYQPKNGDERAAMKAYNTATKVYVERWKANFTNEIPGVRVVDLIGAGHYVFLTRESDVLREIRTFL